MTNAAENLADDLAFCRERVAEIDPWFGLHIVFAHRSQQNAILGLYAFFAMMERAAAMTEPSLCAAQLAWWKSEVEERAIDSAHPVVRVLRVSNVLPVLSGGALPGLFSQALLRVQKNPVSNLEALRALCEEAGSAFVAPEVSLANPGRRHVDYPGSCAGTGLWRLFQLALRHPEAGFWFVPLDLQARHGERLDGIRARHGSAGGVLQSLGEIGEQWFDAQLRELASHGTSEPTRDSHQVAAILTQKRQLAVALKSIGKPGKRAPRAGPIELWRLWSNTRRFNRP